MRRVAPGAAARRLLGTAEVRRRVRAQKELRIAAGRGLDQRLPVRFAFEDRQAVTVRPDPAREALGTAAGLRYDPSMEPIVYDLVDADGETFNYPQSQMSDIAAMMRHAMISATQGKVDAEYVSGHAKIHPFYVPIPSIGHRYVDGNIRRVVVAEPITAAVVLAAIGGSSSSSYRR